MHADGEGVAQDYVLSHLWFNLAAAGSRHNAGNKGSIKRNRNMKRLKEGRLVAQPDHTHSASSIRRVPLIGPLGEPHSTPAMKLRI